MSERRSAPSPTTPDTAPVASVLDAKKAEDIIRQESAEPEAIESAIANPNLEEEQQVTYDRETSRVVLRADRKLRRSMHERARAITQFGELNDITVGNAKHAAKDAYHNYVINGGFLNSGLVADRAKYHQESETALFGFRRNAYAAKERQAKRRLHIAGSFQAAERKRYDAIISHDKAIWKPVTEGKMYIELKKGEFTDLDEAKKKYPAVKKKKTFDRIYYQNDSGEMVPVQDSDGKVAERIVGYEHIAGSREKRHNARDEALRMKIDGLISAQLKLKKHGKEVRRRQRQNSYNVLRAQLAAEGLTFSVEHAVQLRRETLDKLGSNPKMIRVAKKLLAVGLADQDNLMRQINRALENPAA